MSCTSSSLLESLLNESSHLNLSQIKTIYASLEDYQINLCSINESNTSLTRAFSVIGMKLKSFINHFILKTIFRKI